ncbi:MAG TPA: GNAT family N-acetyltransferase [Casimicrobiaceae bacterium]
MQHYLRPLLSPESIALVGASERAGSLGRVVYERLLASGYRGAVHPVNPRHGRVLGRQAWPSLAAIGVPVDLALIATPQHAVADVIASAQATKVAIVMTSPRSIDSAATRAWSDEVRDAAKRAKVRIVGPGALGVIRPSIHLEAARCAASVLPGRIALIAQSGAVATAMLDFAWPLHVGFSAVISVGGAIDVGFGELLDLLLADAETDGILVHVEEIGEARPFVSALRAAARTKPVVVLKAGRSLEPAAEISHDAVFDAALMRSGTVRARTYMQLFAAARILARGRIPQGDRIAIVSNGRGPAVMAADSAFDRRLDLARFTDGTKTKLDALLNGHAPPINPIDVHGDAPPSHLAQAVDIAAGDPNVDAVVALHVSSAVTPALESAQAVAAIGAAHPKPIVAAWLGAVERRDVDDALEAARISNFYTPETAVEALSFLAQYRNNQAMLLEVPPPQPEPQPPDLGPLETLRETLARENHRGIESADAAQILGAFGFVVGQQSHATGAVECGLVTDRRFGPLIFVGPATALSLVQRCAVMLPPLNARLATDLVARAVPDGALRRLDAATLDALVDALTRLSALACMLPWVSALVLDAKIASGGQLTVTNSRFEVDPERRLLRGYPHMSIHPYPVELIGDVALHDGMIVHVRPIRPEDAALERAFVDGLSDETRYFRFFYRISELTPPMLARFTQVDYDREMALVALVDVATSPSFVGVARYIANPDWTSAEFAVVVGDAWQRRGIARVLMRGLIVCAKRRGFERLRGTILRENEPMLAFVRALGFVLEEDPADPMQICATLALAG